MLGRELTLPHRQLAALPRTRTTIASAVLIVTLALGAAACSSDAGDAAPPDTTSPTESTDNMTPQRFDERGPYAVGVTTISLGDRETEVYYPADPSTTDGKPTDSYRTADVFPETLRAFIPPAMDGMFDVGAVRDIAASTAGPFPLVVYSHGFGGYRQVASFYLAHLASWGFVVASTDHSERSIVALATGNLSGAASGKDLDDVALTIAALADESARKGGLLDGRVDTSRVGITGHSAGAQTALRSSGSNADIDAFISISGGLSLMGEAAPDIPAKPALIIAGQEDQVVAASKSAALYGALGSPRYHVEIANAGHNSFTDSCPVILERGGLESLRPVLGRLVDLAQDGCTVGMVDPRLVQRVLNHYSTAFFLTHLGVRDELATLVADVSNVVNGAPLSALQHG